VDPLSCLRLFAIVLVDDWLTDTPRCAASWLLDAFPERLNMEKLLGTEVFLSVVHRKLL
jgi:hypothetical protein